MAAVDKSDQCLHIRQMIEFADDSAALAVQQAVSEHIFSCDSCSQWQKQMGEIIAVASKLPQFDVQEGLTQSIMQRVEKQANAYTKTSIGIMVASALVLSLLLVDSVDSAYGLLSWLSSVLLIGLFDAFLQGGGSDKRAMTQ